MPELRRITAARNGALGGSPSANLLSGGIDEVFTRTDSTGAYSFVRDGLGSTAGLTDSTGTLQQTYTYDPYGNTSTTGNPSSNSYQYTGRETDATGLYYLRARYFSSSLSRFMSEDPIGFAGGNNIYAYSGDDPIDFEDPLGLGKKRDLLSCASEAAADASIAKGIKYVLAQAGNDPSASRDFMIDALAGNAFSGLTDLGKSLFTGEAGGHNVFYNMGQSLVAGPTQGFSGLFGNAVKGTMFEYSVTDLAVSGGYSFMMSDFLGAEKPVQAFLDVAAGEGLEFASGVGELKLAYDTGSYAASLAQCAGGFVQ